MDTGTKKTKVKEPRHKQFVKFNNHRDPQWSSLDYWPWRSRRIGRLRRSQKKWRPSWNEKDRGPMWRHRRGRPSWSQRIRGPRWSWGLEVETIGLRTGGSQNPGEAEGVEGQVQPQALMSAVKPDRPRWSQKDKGPMWGMTGPNGSKGARSHGGIDGSKGQGWVMGLDGCGRAVGSKARGHP